MRPIAGRPVRLTFGSVPRGVFLGLGTRQLVIAASVLNTNLWLDTALCVLVALTSCEGSRYG
jgi:hypothetical protein